VIASRLLTDQRVGRARIHNNSIHLYLVFGKHKYNSRTKEYEATTCALVSLVIDI
jgi:hypothetical protein